PSYPATSGTKLNQLFEADLPEAGRGDAAFDDFAAIAENIRPGNGRFFGYVLGSGEPVGAIADLLASALNQNLTAWRSAPAAVTIERTVVSWLAQAIGCEGFTGSLTGGGSSANLMGLAMARETKLPANESGAQGGTIYASEEAHMSISKAVALLGLGRANLLLVPVDSEFRMRTEELAKMIQQDKAAGKRPIAVVATAGTVNTGAIDPLPDIADIANRENLWFHVDGAYGALAAIAQPEKFRGLALADSLSLDPHKWLYQPLDCGCLLFRDPAAARRAFSDAGDYAKVMNTDPIEGFAFFDESMELSRRFRALKLWVSLRYHGLAAFRSAIQRDLDHAQLLAEKIKANPRLELLAPVGLSAVCFRVRGKDNAKILPRIIQRGRVYISNATIGGEFVLRACFVNHRTTPADVQLIVDEALAAAAEV
ncbi:MAG: pyridoxal phosphate-dependent decarboxylase family protein, partial [Terriglobales bacterium]